MSTSSSHPATRPAHPASVPTSAAARCRRCSWRWHSGFPISEIWNLTGQPAAAVPWDFDGDGAADVGAAGRPAVRRGDAAVAVRADRGRATVGPPATAGVMRLRPHGNWPPGGQLRRRPAWRRRTGGRQPLVVDRRRRRGPVCGRAACRLAPLKYTRVMVGWLAKRLPEVVDHQAFRVDRGVRAAASAARVQHIPECDAVGKQCGQSGVIAGRCIEAEQRAGDQRQGFGGLPVILTGRQRRDTGE